MLSALLWLGLLQLISAMSIPLSFRVFSRMPDRGYAFTKVIGLLIVGFSVWLIGLSQIVTVSRLAVLIAIAILAFVSWIAAGKDYKEIWSTTKANLSLIISIELLYITIFCGMALLRASIPDISHTEQPMDLMFLSSVVASEHFPPIDSWLSGEHVSYYYLGYVFVGSITLLTGIETWVAYNLGLAMFAAMTAVTAFGLTYNLVLLCRGSRESGIFAGITTVFLALLASNLVGVLELFRASGGGDSNFWSSIAIAGLTQSEPSNNWFPTDSAWWWWRASRAIPGAITEFPAFSFLLGDMHPHLMSLAFLLFATSLSIQIYLQQGLLHLSAFKSLWPLLLITSISLGSLIVTNLWDFPVALALIASSILLNAARNERRLQLGKAIVMNENSLLISSTTGPQNNSPMPCVRIFNFSEKGWKFNQKLTAEELGTHSGFGDALAISESLIAVGCSEASKTGIVRVYKKSKEKWIHKATLRPSQNSKATKFGCSVSADSGVIAVGSEEKVYLFNETEKGWVIFESFPIETNNSEQAVKVSVHNNYLAVGLTTPSSGVLRIYRMARTRWSLSQQFSSSEMGIRQLGGSIAMNDDHVVVAGIGSVAVLKKQKTNWVVSQILYPSKPSESFGESVAIDNTFIVVGANNESNPSSRSGKLFVYELSKNGFWSAHAELSASDTSTNATLGTSVAIANGYASAGAPGQGQGAVYFFQRSLDKWAPAGKIGGPWRLSRALSAIGLLLFSSYVVSSPFLMNFESSAKGIAPLSDLLTRPLHLFFIWGISAFLILPMFVLLLRHSLSRETWSPIRLGVILVASLAPIMLWLQPIYGIPLFTVILLLFGLHQIGYRLPRADEALFAYNPRFTFIVGSLVIIGGLIWNGIISNERGLGGELLAIDRLLVVLPIAILMAIGFYSAWSLAHKDSEHMRHGRFGREALTRWNGFVPIFLIFSISISLIMGAELFHVVDIFGGELKRFNTVFKLYYQSWILLSVIGGVGLWYVSTKWDKRTLTGRTGLTAWLLVLVVIFGGLSYYSFAGISTRTQNHDYFTLNGLSYVSKTAPEEYELIKWVNQHTNRNSIVLQGSLVPCTASQSGCNDWDPRLGRIASATGRPTVLGWEGHEQQWRTNHSLLEERQDDIREIYTTTDPSAAKILISKYGIDYVVISKSELEIYGTKGKEKFKEFGSVVFEGTDLLMYKLD